ERDGQACLPALQQKAKACIRLFRGTESGVLTHRPQAAAVHARLNAASERILAGIAQVAIVISGSVRWAIHHLNRNSGGSLAAGVDFLAAHRRPSGNVTQQPGSIITLALRARGATASDLPSSRPACCR